MSKQRLLFKPQRSPWVDRLWRQLPAKTHREIVAALAEMARLTLKQVQQHRAQRRKKEGNDES